MKFYIYVGSENDYESLKKIFLKYNVGCVNTYYPCVAKYTLKVHTKRYDKGSVFLEFENESFVDEFERWSNIEKVLCYPIFINEIKGELNEEKDKDLKEYITKFNGIKQEYKIDEYARYKLFERLPFSDAEYEIFDYIYDLNFNDLLSLIKKEGYTVNEALEKEKVSLVSSKPEKKYTDKVDAIYAILESAIKKRTIITEGQANVDLDFDSIKEELENFAKDNNIKLYIDKDWGINFSNHFNIIMNNKVSRSGKITYWYRYDKTTKNKIAMEIRRKETDCLY